MMLKNIVTVLRMLNHDEWWEIVILNNPTKTLRWVLGCEGVQGGVSRGVWNGLTQAHTMTAGLFLFQYVSLCMYYRSIGAFVTGLCCHPKFQHCQPPKRRAISQMYLDAMFLRDDVEPILAINGLHNAFGLS